MDQRRVRLQQKLVRLFQDHARPLSPSALDRLSAFLLSAPDDEWPQLIQDMILKLPSETVTVSADDITALTQPFVKPSACELIQVLDALACRRIGVDDSRNRFFLEVSAPTLYAAADSKPQAALDRLQSLKVMQLRAARSPEQWTGTGHPLLEAQITPIKALVSTLKTCMLFGMLRTCGDGAPRLEDGTAAVPVDLHAATSCTSGLVVDGGIYMLSGQRKANGTFAVRAAHNPVPIPRNMGQDLLQGLQLYGAKPLSTEALSALNTSGHAQEVARVVFAAGCVLDEAGSRERLASMLIGFDEMEGEPPAMIVLLGPFFQDMHTASDLRLYTQGLADLLAMLPRLQEKTVFVLVPSKGDPGDLGTLPQPPLSEAISKPLQDSAADVRLASNPCRIQFYTKEIVAFAHPCTTSLLQHALLCTNDCSAQGLFSATCHTILAQMHLTPLQLRAQPVIWQLESALRLFPVPHALVFTEPGEVQSCCTNGVRCISPGSLGDGAFVTYVPRAPADAAALDAEEEGPARLGPKRGDSTTQQQNAGCTDARSDLDDLVEVCFVPEAEDENDGGQEDELGGNVSEDAQSMSTAGSASDDPEELLEDGSDDFEAQNGEDSVDLL